jgi:hypothetical protein
MVAVKVPETSLSLTANTVMEQLEPALASAR